MPFVGFEQDPNAQPGWGTFVNDTGGKGYFFDPGLANELSARAEGAGAVARNAQNANSFASAMTGEPPPVQPITEPQALTAESKPPAQSSPVAITNEQPPEPIDPREVGSNALVQNAFAPVREAPRPGGFLPKGQTTTVEQSGLPYSEEDAVTRADLNTNVRLAHQAKADHEASIEMAQAEGARAAIPELQRRADEAQAQRDQQFAAYQAERAELQQLIDAAGSKQIDPNRMFKRGPGGAAAMLGTVIAQALGTYSSARWGGPNAPQELINRAIDHDVMAQKAEWEASQGKVRNAFGMLNDRYRDAGQAETALRLVQQQIAAQQVAAFAGASKAQGIQDAAAEWDAVNLQQREALEEQLRAASMGKRTISGTASYQAPSAGGMRNPTAVEINRNLDTAKKFNEVTGLDADRAAALKGQEKKGSQGNLVITNADGSQALARTEKEAQELRQFEGLRRQAQRSLAAIKAMSGTNFKKENQNKIRTHLEAIVNVSNKLQGQGVVRGEDMDRYVDALSARYGITLGGIDPKAVDELAGIVDGMYQGLVDAQAAPEVRERQTPAGPALGFTGRAAKTPTAGGGGPKRVLP